MNKQSWVGYQDRQELRPRSEAVEAAAAARACTAQGGCTAVSGLLSRGTGGLSAFSGLSPEANSFQLRGDHFTLPWSSSSGLPLVCDFCFPRIPSVAFRVGCPGANPWDCSCRPDSIPGHSQAGLSWWCDCTSGDHNELAVFQWLLKSLDQFS